MRNRLEVGEGDPCCEPDLHAEGDAMTKGLALAAVGEITTGVALLIVPSLVG